MAPRTSSARVASVKGVDERSLAGTRILHVVTRYAKGGSEQRLRDILDATSDGTHHVVVGCDSEPDRLAREFPQISVEVEPALQRAPHPTKDPAAYRALRARMRAESYDLVCTHQSKAGFLGRLAARDLTRAGAVHSLSMANFGPGYSAIESTVFRCAERFLARYTTAYAVVGADLAEKFSRCGVDPARLHIIRSGARLPKNLSAAAARTGAASQFDLPNDRPWILALGSLDGRKNVMSLPVLLQQVLLHWPDRNDPPFLVIAGDGPLRQDLSALLEQMDLSDDALLLGHVGDPRPLIAGSDVMVLLSNAEGLPQVLVQAAAANLPFVAYEVDGVEELLRRGASGRSVDPGNVLAASEQVIDVLQRGARHTTAIDLDEWDRNSILESYRGLFLSLLDPA